jgi:hypothetical protein
MSAITFAPSKALRFAWAAAQERTGIAESDAQVNSWDLLVGAVLAGPGPSEAAQAFEAFELVAGQALPGDYPQLTAAGLNRRLADLPPDGTPPLDSDADAVINMALSIGDTNSPDAIEGRVLWAALLQGTSAASIQVQALLRQRSVDSSLLATATSA